MGTRNESMDKGVCERTTSLKAPTWKQSKRCDDPYLSVSLEGVTWRVIDESEDCCKKIVPFSVGKSLRIRLWACNTDTPLFE